jgi:hypothetical protein
MPTPEALEKLKNASERMAAANEEHLAFLEKSPDEQFSPKERLENRRLLDNLNRAMDEYWQAFDQAAKS